MSEKYNSRHECTANYISIRIPFDGVAQDAGGHGIRQIVRPRADMDARAYRLPWPDGTVFSNWIIRNRWPPKDKSWSARVLHQNANESRSALI